MYQKQRTISLLLQINVVVVFLFANIFPMKVSQTSVNIEHFFILEINVFVNSIRVIALDIQPLRVYTETQLN